MANFSMIRPCFDRRILGKAIAIFVAVALRATAGEPPITNPATHLADIGRAPSIALVDVQGRPFDLVGLRGKCVVVSFIYTTCGGSCPATTHNLYRVQQALKEAKLWGTDVAFVSVTLDPARDTQGVLANYARAFGADARAWHFLTGPPAEVGRVIAAWGMWARVGPAGTLDHPSRIFLVDPCGRQREIYSLEFLTPEAVLQDVRALREEHAHKDHQ